MICSRCGENITPGQPYHRTKRGPHHADNGLGNCKPQKMPCHVCGKTKGQLPGQCNGHYEGTASDPANYKEQL